VSGEETAMPPDLATLREEFPAWQFGTVWTSANSGWDARRLTATRDGVLLTAWNAPELRLKIRAEETPRRAG
jgi:hypothetical protein